MNFITLIVTVVLTALFLGIGALSTFQMVVEGFFTPVKNAANATNVDALSTR